MFRRLNCKEYYFFEYSKWKPNTKSCMYGTLKFTRKNISQDAFLKLCAPCYIEKGARLNFINIKIQIILQIINLILVLLETKLHLCPTFITKPCLSKITCTWWFRDACEVTNYWKIKLVRENINPSLHHVLCFAHPWKHYIFHYVLWKKMNSQNWVKSTEF